MRNTTYNSSYSNAYRNTPSSGYGKGSVPAYQAGYLKPAPVHSTAARRTDIHVPTNTVKNRKTQFEGSGRPLPPGPGPLDSRNRKISYSEPTSLRPTRSGRRDTEPPSPVKGDHSVGGNYSTSSRVGFNNGHTHTSSSNGYHYDYSPKSHSLSRRKEHSSSSSLSNDSQNSTAEDIQALKLTDSRHTMSSTASSAQELPDIHRTRDRSRVDEAGDDRRGSRMRTSSSDLSYIDAVRASVNANFSYTHNVISAIKLRKILFLFSENRASIVISQ